MMAVIEQPSLTNRHEQSSNRSTMGLEAFRAASQAMKASNSPSKSKANKTARESPLKAILERDSCPAEVAATK